MNIIRGVIIITPALLVFLGTALVLFTFATNRRPTDVPLGHILPLGVGFLGVSLYLILDVTSRFGEPLHWWRLSLAGGSLWVSAVGMAVLVVYEFTKDREQR